MRKYRLVLLVLSAGLWLPAAEDWTSGAPRDEIAPRFRRDPATGSLHIASDGRPGLDGYWMREFPVEGGRHYRFRVLRKLENVPVPRRSALVTIVWLDERGRRAPTDGGGSSQPDNPVDGEPGAGGWTEVSGLYRAPSRAVRARVSLHLRWAKDGRAEWKDAAFAEATPPAGRRARLAAVHFKPRGGKSPEDNRRMFEPLVAEAGRQRADLLVLGEVVTSIGNGYGYAEAAEPIPGPSTRYFGELARRHDLYIVAGLLERDGHLVYNTAALLAPDGSLAGKYRKVTLPPGETEGGIAPGSEYPVFDTRFGKLGMMICYDVFFPDVARELAARGAEVIALPIYGGNIHLAKARAIDNHVYLVTATYMEPAHEWMRTGIFDHQGRLIASASVQGAIALAEVDLDQPTDWRWLGRFRNRIPRDRPVVVGEGH